MNDHAYNNRDDTSARPTAVTTAFVAFVAAVGWGVAETAIRGVRCATDDTADIGSLAGPWVLRAVVYVLVLGTAWRMSRGDRWARILLTAGIGVIGTASLVVEPIAMFAASGMGLFADLDATAALLTITRIGHLGAVFVAIPAMYTPAARSWFRTGPGVDRPATV